MTEHEPGAALGPFPRVPHYAWDWLQRSRPVLTEAAQRLTGGPPAAGFVDGLRTAFPDDAFLRGVVIDVIADVAFHGRVPARRPTGVSWDRGLTWWAAALAGVALADFEGRADLGDTGQRALFEAPSPKPRLGRRHVTMRGPAVQRRALAAALRELLSQADGGQIPASAVRRLLQSLEDPS